MPKVALLNVTGAQVGDIELNDAVFGIEPNESVVHEAVVMQMASWRQGTHCTKSRGEVRGGGRKPWRQKGTGRARVGTSRSPIWRGGAIIFGPKPREYSYSIPKKKRRLALKSVLSSKVADNDIIVLDTLNFDQPKTKEMVKVLSNLNAEKALIVMDGSNKNVMLSARNIPEVKTAAVNTINVYDLLKYNTLVMTKEAVAKIEEVYA